MGAAGAPGQKKSLKDLRNGAVLQMAEAATLGLPLEVWKTRMGRFRSEGTLTAFRNVYNAGGGGIGGVTAFWAGFAPKMIEAGTKGAVLMVAKEGIKDGLAKANVDPFLGAIIAGGGGGVAQTVIISPMVSVLGVDDSLYLVGRMPFFLINVFGVPVSNCCHLAISILSL